MFKRLLQFYTIKQSSNIFSIFLTVFLISASSHATEIIRSVLVMCWPLALRLVEDSDYCAVTFTSFAPMCSTHNRDRFKTASRDLNNCEEFMQKLYWKLCNPTMNDLFTKTIILNKIIFPSPFIMHLNITALVLSQLGILLVQGFLR